jgi:hypothetical protein
MTTSNIVARRAVFDEVGVFDDLRYAHDLDFFLRLLVHGKRLQLLRRPLLTDRVHAGNTIAEAPSRARLKTAVRHGLLRAAIWVEDASGKWAALPLAPVGGDRSPAADAGALSLLQARHEGMGGLSPGACLADPAFSSALLEIA